MEAVYSRSVERWRLEEHGEPLDPKLLFDVDGRMVLEIGCGRGDLAISYAVAHPDDLVMAIDIHTRGIANILAGIERHGLTNVRVIEGDAQVFVRRLPPASIDEMWVFFPDPWPKARHRNRRLLRDDLIGALAAPIKPGGILRLATDIDDYARHATSSIARSELFEPPTFERPSWRTPTVFERRGLDQGRRSVDLSWVRRDMAIGSDSEA
jgi:tRNA (guanine-N7-)-methyltransferase